MLVTREINESSVLFIVLLLDTLTTAEHGYAVAVKKEMRLGNTINYTTVQLQW